MGDRTGGAEMTKECDHGNTWTCEECEQLEEKEGVEV
jgi:hypothetical protein